MDSVGALLDGAVVVITGGTGTLSQALTAEIMAHYYPRKLILLSRSESRQAALRERYPETNDSPIRFFLGDVRDPQRMLDVLEGADIVIHAAALKRVEVVEREPAEAVATNIVGTLNVAQAAKAVGVQRFMFISSDKCCQAATLYGGTKYVAERAVIAMNSYRGASGIRYSAVRYGNVLGSTGSALHTFRACNGTVPIMDKRMSRFWITPQNAARFVLSSLAMMKGAEVFVPLLPSAMITTMAEAFAPDAKQEEVGLIRGAEKLAESLISPDEAPWTVELPDRYILLPALSFWPGGDWPEAKRVPEGFSYTSANNTDWLTAEALREMAGE